MLRELLDKLRSPESREEMKKKGKKIKNIYFDSFSEHITPEDKGWEVIRKLQEAGKLDSNLKEVYIYEIPRQYERRVYEMEHWKILETTLSGAFYFLSYRLFYNEDVFHYTCYNPREGRLHVLLGEGRSVEDLPSFLQHEHIFNIPQLYK